MNDRNAGKPTGLSLFFHTTLLDLLPLILALVPYSRRHSKKETHRRARLVETVKSGLATPLTLHPVMNTNT